MLRIIFFAAAAASFSATPAAASIALWCTGPAGVSFDAPLSGGAGLSVRSARIEAAGRAWSTETADGVAQAIVPAQSWGDDTRLWFDFADANLEANVIEVRISWRGDEDLAGRLDIIDVGSWDVACVLG